MQPIVSTQTGTQAPAAAVIVAPTTAPATTAAAGTIYQGRDLSEGATHRAVLLLVCNKDGEVGHRCDVSVLHITRAPRADAADVDEEGKPSNTSDWHASSKHVDTNLPC